MDERTEAGDPVPSEPTGVKGTGATGALPLAEAVSSATGPTGGPPETAAARPSGAGEAAAPRAVAVQEQRIAPETVGPPVSSAEALTHHARETEDRVPELMETDTEPAAPTAETDIVQSEQRRAEAGGGTQEGVALAQSDAPQDPQSPAPQEAAAAPPTLADGNAEAETAKFAASEARQAAPLEAEEPSNADAAGVPLVTDATVGHSSTAVRQARETQTGLAAPETVAFPAVPPQPVPRGAAAGLTEPLTFRVGTTRPPAFRPQEPPHDSAPSRMPASLPSREAIGRLLPYLRLALRAVAAVAVGMVAIVLLQVALYRWIDPPASMLMLGQRLGGTQIERKWVPLDRISPHLIRAVVLSEDGGFCRHRGVDWRALEEAIEGARGGSTITMQVVKNLFLWPSRSYVRKTIEIFLAYLVELVWPKRRILEIYLNVAEWGDGVFGAEAAARYHFLKSAARLTPQEAALLAVSLPAPLERRPASPSAGLQRLAAKLLVRMQTSRTSLACVRAPRHWPTGAAVLLVPGLAERLPL